MQSFRLVYIVVFGIARWNVYPLHTHKQGLGHVFPIFFSLCVSNKETYSSFWIKMLDMEGFWKTKPIISSSLTIIVHCEDVSHSPHINHELNFNPLSYNYTSSNCPQPSPSAPTCTIQSPPPPQRFLKIHLLKAKHMCTVAEERKQCNRKPDGFRAGVWEVWECARRQSSCVEFWVWNIRFGSLIVRAMW